MALILNEEQIMLQDAARNYLRESAPVSHLRQLRDQGSIEGFSRELWRDMADMGWTAILVPEEFGGLAYGYTGLGIVLEECGRTLAPSPLLATALTGVTALTLAGSKQQQAELLPAVAAGSHLLALACDESARHRPAQVASTAESVDQGYLLQGSKTAVVDGHIADTLIVNARTSGGISLFLVPADSAGVTIERYPVLDTHAAARVIFDSVKLPAGSLLGELDEGQDLLDRVLDAARTGAAAEMLGIAQEAFARTVDYLKQRKQFGVPIGSFQALQHRAAHLYAEIELCKSVVLKALQTLDEDPLDAAEAASLAKAKLCETAHLATTEAIQMHGGIGMTDDFDIGFFLKRCKILEHLYGDRYFHQDRFARLQGY
ncbi:MAG: acyl-CoA dehydrogenase [Xanthomonadales bacterium]|nr:acyl-CoA dehydrogenase [Gammaproteobacteria bacterium]MBT8053170.1 acyl-CoA dehydrogenase [Gammaproteobacteria bacterium]NND56078.1 acyl-CoA dehydrogenase [Xanthomonadales bacterium]NNK50209.1 acyl-CoA dehydrogenase [Xanthomonadales bacterium]